MNLKHYLQKEWIKNNHVRYHGYFEEWFDNLTENQKYYYDIAYHKSLN
jgi:hypothetical protein